MKYKLRRQSVATLVRLWRWLPKVMTLKQLMRLASRKQRRTLNGIK